MKTQPKGTTVKAASLTLLLLASLPVLAQHAEGLLTPGEINRSGALLWLAIAFWSKRKPLGGWLFFYYFTLYTGLIINLAITDFDLLSPSGWEAPALYTLYVLSIGPTLLAFILEIIFSTRLLFKSQRSKRRLDVLRYVLAASIVTAIWKGVINYYFFTELDTLQFDIATVISFSIWCRYFFVSRRVAHVFSNSQSEWDYESFAKKESQA